MLPREQQDVSHAFAMKKKSCEQLSLQLDTSGQKLPAGCMFAARVCLPTPGKLQSKQFSTSFSVFRIFVSDGRFINNLRIGRILDHISEREEPNDGSSHISGEELETVSEPVHQPVG